jgi:selenophosphate synthase
MAGGQSSSMAKNDAICYKILPIQIIQQNNMQKYFANLLINQTAQHNNNAMEASFLVDTLTSWQNNQSSTGVKK